MVDLDDLRRQLASLTTEAIDPDFSDLDLMTTPELVAAMIDHNRQVTDALTDASHQLASAVDAAAERMQRGGRLLYVGAGTPGRLGILDASEIPPTFGEPAERVVGIIAGGERAIQWAVENAEDDVAAGRADIARAGVGPDDCVVGLTASGRTPYVLGAIAEARARGAATVGVSCNQDSELSAAADVGVEVIVGPELVAGSTRLKAGTAQKIVLNTISTFAMVRIEPGAIIVLAAFGAGLSWGAAVIRWGQRVEPLGTSDAALPPNNRSTMDLLAPNLEFFGHLASS